MSRNECHLCGAYFGSTSGSIASVNKRRFQLLAHVGAHHGKVLGFIPEEAMDASQPSLMALFSSPFPESTGKVTSERVLEMLEERCEVKKKTRKNKVQGIRFHTQDIS